MQNRYKEAFCGDVRHLNEEDVNSNDERDAFHRKHAGDNRIPDYNKLINHEAQKFENKQKPQGLQKYFSAMFDAKKEENK